MTVKSTKEPKSRKQANKSTMGSKPKKKHKVWKWILGVFIAIAIAGTLSDISDRKEGGKEDGQENHAEYTGQTTQNAQYTPGTGSDENWTVMIYLCGADLESRDGLGTKTLSVLEKAQIDCMNQNVLVCTGGAGQWYNSVPADSVVIWQLTDSGLTELSNLGNISMGAEETLASFLNYGETNFPAGHRALVLDDHGGGPIGGSCYDENFDNDSISLKELSAVLNDNGFTENKLDLLEFNTCLMGGIEEAFALGSTVNYMSASEELAWSVPEKYQVLEDLDTYQDGKELGQAFVEIYANACEGSKDYTACCLDLSRVTEVYLALDNLSLAIDAGSAGESFAVLSTARGSMISMGTYSSDRNYDLVDLGLLAENLEQFYPEEAGELGETLDGLVVCNRSNVSYATGVSIYFPYDDIEHMAERSQYYQTMEFNGYFASLMQSFAQWYAAGVTMTPETGLDLTVRPQVTGTEIEVFLSDALRDTYVRGQYWILKKTPDDVTYMMAYCGRDMRLDGNTLSTTYKNRIIGIKDTETGEWTPYPITLLALNSTEADGYRYEVPVILSKMDQNGQQSEVQGAYLQMRIGEEYPEIIEVFPQMTDDSLMAASPLAISNYDMIQFLCYEATPAVGEDGKYLPFSQWITRKHPKHMDFVIAPADSEKDETMAGDLVKAEYVDIDPGEEYYVMVEVKDINGQKHVSNLVPLKE